MGWIFGAGKGKLKYKKRLLHVAEKEDGIVRSEKKGRDFLYINIRLYDILKE
jgi:hypothetical protein